MINICFIFSFFPATIWFVIGYIVLAVSSRTEGNIQKFGRILAFWVFTLASMIPVIGAYSTLSGDCPILDILSLLREM
ncbi:MAG: hypothetical protein OEY64_07945 [Nitrospinota bacterium]|nr:hypothetical protein [Nitrospinota bacterium]